MQKTSIKMLLAFIATVIMIGAFSIQSARAEYLRTYTLVNDQATLISTDYIDASCRDMTTWSAQNAFINAFERASGLDVRNFRYTKVGSNHAWVFNAVDYSQTIPLVVVCSVR